MTRTMYDAINPLFIPKNATMVAGYVNGHWPSYNGYVDGNNVWIPSIRELFPHAIHVSIAVSADANAQVADCETYDLTPAECVDWALRQRARGQEPTVYMNESTWPYVVNEFIKRGVREPQWWVAKYDNVAQMMPGAVAKQYGGVTNEFDLSIVADNWPGIDGSEECIMDAELGAAIIQLQGEPTHPSTGSLLNVLHAIQQSTTAIQAASNAIVAAIKAIPPSSGGGSTPSTGFTGTVDLTPKA